MWEAAGHGSPVSGKEECVSWAKRGLLHDQSSDIGVPLHHAHSASTAAQARAEEALVGCASTDDVPVWDVWELAVHKELL